MKERLMEPLSSPVASVSAVYSPRYMAAVQLCIHCFYSLRIGRVLHITLKIILMTKHFPPYCSVTIKACPIPIHIFFRGNILVLG